ncbi:MAG: heavy metal translocating P-type ATPase [Haloarculaceae archaeon]
MSCTLCDLPTPDPPVTGPGVDGRFCCRGCLEVARTLDDPAAADADDVRADLADADADAAAADGETAYLAVEGMHCATCEAFLESRARGHDGVLAASASYPADVVRLTYDPARVDREALPGVLDGLGYRASLDPDADAEDDSVGRLLVGGFFGMMVMLWYLLFLYPTYAGLPARFRLLDVTGGAGTYLLWNVWVMATVVLGYTGFPLLRGAYVSLRAGRPNMDLLVALAAGTAYLYSTVALLLGRTELYFDITVVVVLAVTLGTYYESRVKRRAAGQLARLTEERAESARRRTGDGTETVPVADLAPGETVVVRGGERVPVDGCVVEGTAAADESLVTGESLPVRKAPGDEVIGGSLLADGGLVVEVGADATSTLDRLVDLLWSVQSGRPGAQRLADRLAAVFVPAAVAIAVAATAGHLLLGASPTAALLTGLAVLVVSCPCALGLATPLAVASGVRAALDRGVVVTDASAFERAPAADVVVLDKTGTLTTGEMTLLDVVPAGADADALLTRAAAVEQFSDHPVAGAVTDAAPAPDLAVTDVEQFPGRGVGASVAGERVVVGRWDLLHEAGMAVPDDLGTRYESARADGHVPALVGWDGAARGLLVAGDAPREGWADAVTDLRDRVDEVVVLTGDDGPSADRYRDHPAVTEVFAGVPPEGKAATVERLRQRGTVVMVGDGSNDAPALATADLGIALERGTRLAAEAADAVVTTDDLATVPTVFDLTAETNRRIRQNLGWALLYNAVALPVAALGFLNPLVAAVAMATSSLLVVANSARSLD